MTAEQVFKLYRSYKFFYSGRIKFDGEHAIIRHPPFIEQRDRAFYYKMSVKMNDATIHALFTLGFFFKPHAYASDLVTPEAMKAALVFAGREENGRPLFVSDLYELAKRLSSLVDIDAWLYGESDGGIRADMPGCLQEVIAGHVPLDIACLLLLIPQPEREYNWPFYWSSRSTATLELGPQPWIDRLKKADQLINMQRTNWRLTSRELASKFWSDLNVTSLAPVVTEHEPSLF